jgi:hypothetical protein
MINRLVILLRQQPLSIKIFVVLCSSLALFHYIAEVRVPLSATVADSTITQQQQIKLPSADFTEQMRSWLDSLQQSEQNLQDQHSNSETLLPLLTDATQMGNWLIRVKATFTSSQPLQSVAVLELQHPDTREISIRTVREQDAIDDYQVSAIDGQMVRFSFLQHGAPQQITLRVFDFTSSNDSKGRKE